MENGEKEKKDDTNKSIPSSSSDEGVPPTKSVIPRTASEQTKITPEDVPNKESSISTQASPDRIPQISDTDRSENVSFHRKPGSDKESSKTEIPVRRTEEVSKLSQETRSKTAIEGTNEIPVVKETTREDQPSTSYQHKLYPTSDKESSKTEIPVSRTEEVSKLPQETQLKTALEETNAIPDVKETTREDEPSTSYLHKSRSKSQTLLPLVKSDTSPTRLKQDIQIYPDRSRSEYRHDVVSKGSLSKYSITTDKSENLKDPQPSYGLPSDESAGKVIASTSKPVSPKKSIPTRESKTIDLVESINDQDVSVPRQNLQSVPMLPQKVEKKPHRPGSLSPSQSIDGSRDASMSSRTISLDRTSSRMDVRVSTQAERATSQGDVQTLRTVGAIMSESPPDTRSTTISVIATASRGDNSPPPSLIGERGSTNTESPSSAQPTVIIPPPSPSRAVENEPPSVHTARSILRKTDSTPEGPGVSGSKRFIFSQPSGELQPLQDEEMFTRALGYEAERASADLRRTYSHITFPSLSSPDASTSTGPPQPKLKRKQSSSKSRLVPSRKSSNTSRASRASRTTTTTTTTDTDISDSEPTEYVFVEDLEEAHQRAGGNSWSTWRILIAATAPGFINMWLLASTVLLTSLVRFRCKIDELDDAKWTDYEQRELLGARPDEDICTIPRLDYGSLSRQSFDVAGPRARKLILITDREPCREYVFELGNATLVAEFRLVCDRGDLLLLFQVMAGIGMGVGAICFGSLCDHFGRRPVFIVSLVMYTLCFPMSVIIPDYWAITISHFLCGFANSGCFISAMVIMIEWSRASNRPVIGVMMFIPWGMGLTFIAIVAFYVTEWWYLQITIAIPAAALLVCAFVLPESPRWLNAIGKRAKAWRVIQKIRREIRPVVEPEDDTSPANIRSRINTSTKYWGYLSSKRELRWRLIICMMSCFAAGTVYYMVILRAGAYGVLVHFLLALSGVLEMIACAFTIILLSTFGARPTSSILFLVCGAAVSFSTFVPENMLSVVLFLLMLARLISCILFFTVVIQTVELFPTLVRATALGIVLMFTYIFGFVVPLIVVGSSATVNQSAVRNAYCVFAVICGVLVLLLPCTRRRFLTDTIEDVEQEAERGVQVSCRNVYTRD